MIANEKNAAMTSSSIMPKPPFTRLSITEIGQGLRISKTLNKMKPINIHNQSLVCEFNPYDFSYCSLIYFW